MKKLFTKKQKSAVQSSKTVLVVTGVLIRCCGH